MEMTNLIGVDHQAKRLDHVHGQIDHCDGVQRDMVAGDHMEMTREEKAAHANALALYRRVLGVSQSVFEEMSGVSRSSIRQYETTGYISDQMLDGVLERLGCTRDSLLAWADNTMGFVQQPPGET